MTQHHEIKCSECGRTIPLRIQVNKSATGPIVQVWVDKQGQESPPDRGPDIYFREGP